MAASYLPSDDVVVCTSPPLHASGLTTLQVSVNGQQFTPHRCDARASNPRPLPTPSPSTNPSLTSPSTPHSLNLSFYELNITRLDPPYSIFEGAQPVLLTIDGLTGFSHMGCR